MIDALRRAFAKKAAIESQPTAPVTKTVAAPANRKWSERDFPLPAIPGKVEAKAEPEPKQSMHYKIVRVTK